MALPRFIIDMVLKNPFFEIADGTAKVSHHWQSGTTPANGDIFTLTVDGKTVTYNYVTGDLNAGIVTGLVAAWEAATARAFRKRTAYDAQQETVTISGTIPAVGDIYYIDIGEETVNTTGHITLAAVATGLMDAINDSTLTNFKGKTASVSGAVVTFWDDEDPSKNWTAAVRKSSGAASTIALATLAVVAIRANLVGVDHSVVLTDNGAATVNDLTVVANVGATPTGWTKTATAGTFVQEQSGGPYDSGITHLYDRSVKSVGDGNSAIFHQDIPYSTLLRGLRNGKKFGAVCHVHIPTGATVGASECKLVVKLMEGSTVRQTATTNVDNTADDLWRIAEASITIDMDTYPDADAIRIELHNDSNDTVYFDTVLAGYFWDPLVANNEQVAKWRSDTKQHGWEQVFTAGAQGFTDREHDYESVRLRWKLITEAAWYTFQDIWEDAQNGRPFCAFLDRDASSIETDLVKRRKHFLQLMMVNTPTNPYDPKPGFGALPFECKARSIRPVE